ncbi:hypothetical protein PFICI_13333 [Pestalotiopsis fici W106-1]|uniref:Phenol 2-monooxygenase n=1 Tax=Pestalotiopsis fici (strain W106-1 / CGMCC3.15140) TaxID=1229662 RepID=W3WM61_PESFW|nr:uncharacterized protein PFICI_13333 [Pestalotiopsis fici W106-1]ETS74849.1 hypothetical protein PFICI_13333 [Pestalotiopsis fici W106-1]
MDIDGHDSESSVDVLIIGAGPAGLMAAAWMAHCGVHARIIDKRNAKVFCGQADGLNPRSQEIFESFGFVDRFRKEAYYLNEVWATSSPDENGVIRRGERTPDTPPGLSRFMHATLHQGRIERFFLDNIKKYSKDTIQVERGVMPESLAIEETKVHDQTAYPVTVKLRRLNEEESTPKQHGGAQFADGLFRSNLFGEADEDALLQRSYERAGESETVHAKYVIGCDGARSWTRNVLGFELQGESIDAIWGVMDIVPFTDFPGIRERSMIQSAEYGSLMVIPRENNLVRLYIQLIEVKLDATTGRADKSKITPESIFDAAKKILQPYKIEYDVCDWWTAYQIGQRVGTHFQAHDRVFLAGDAVHTHSPKAGQGMNVSMQDCYNLGWKLALVIKGIAQPSILSTYEAERRRVAQELIAIDHRLSRQISGKPVKDSADPTGINPDDFKKSMIEGHLFFQGLSINYGPSSLIAKPSEADEHGNGGGIAQSTKINAETFAKRQALATGLPVGMRFNSCKVLDQSDGRIWHLQEKLKSDGRFRIVLFAGNILDPAQKQRVEHLCTQLDAPSNFLRRITGTGSIDSIVEILTIHSAKRHSVELLRDFPDILHPFSRQTGWGYHQVYCDDVSVYEGFGDAYVSYGVDKDRGCVVVVRPDQIVAWVGELDDFDDLQSYFQGCLLLSD